MPTSSFNPLILSDKPAGEPAVSISQAVLDVMPEPVLLLQLATGALRAMNAAGTEWLSHATSDGAEVHFADVFPDLNLAALPTSDAGMVLAKVNRRPDLGSREVVLRVLPLARDSIQRDEPQSIAIVIRAVASRIAERDFLPRDAFDNDFHDSLTRLPNRRLFQRRIERAMDRGEHANYHFALLFVDLDGFKRINDLLGHLEGDRLLLVAAQRMLEAVRPQDMVARRDGDEFTILLDDLAQSDDAVHIAQRIIQHLQAPLTIDGAGSVSLGASIGIAMGGYGKSTSDQLIARADAAMYRAKRSGGNMFVLADDAAESDGLAKPHAPRLPR